MEEIIQFQLENGDISERKNENNNTTNQIKKKGNYYTQKDVN